MVLSVALSTLLLLGVERLRNDVRENFSQSVSGTDLIVGARTGAMQLMLYAVFRVGGATNNVRMDSLEAIAKHRAVAWMVPLSLGDSHRGFPVLATTPATSNISATATSSRWRWPRAGRSRAIGAGCTTWCSAPRWRGPLGYRSGERLTLSHGGGEMPGSEHADKPFTVVGILQRTGTPVDRTLHIGLQAMEAIHLDWVAGVPLPAMKVAAEQARQLDLQPKQVTAALLGLKSRAAVFAVQRAVADFEAEPLMAVLPGVALDELWDVVGVGERALLAHVGDGRGRQPGRAGGRGAGRAERAAARAVGAARGGRRAAPCAADAGRRGRRDHAAGHACWESPPSAWPSPRPRPGCRRSTASH